MCTSVHVPATELIRRERGLVCFIIASRFKVTSLLTIPWRLSVMIVRILIGLTLLFGCFLTNISVANDTVAVVKVDFSIILDDGEQWSPTLIVNSGDTGEILIKKTAADGTMVFYKMTVSAKADAPEDSRGATLSVQLARSIPAGTMRTLYAAEHYVPFGTSVTDEGAKLKPGTATAVSFFVSKINDPSDIQDSDGRSLSGLRTSGWTGGGITTDMKCKPCADGVSICCSNGCCSDAANGCPMVCD